MIGISLVVVFFYAPVELTMGNVQRIFYFHVGSAWVASVAFFIALLSGIGYLRNPSRTWDTIAVGSVEIGLVFTTMTIVSGSVWGRPAWNTWWIWSPRLTSITVLWLVYVAYFMLRGAIEDEEKRGRFAAVYVIAGFVTVIITFLSIRLLRDIHPVIIGQGSEAAEGLQEFSGIDSLKMVITLNVSVLTFTVLYLAWLANRLRLQRMVDEAAALKTLVMARLQQ
jgi:heme exporter protein C